MLRYCFANKFYIVIPPSIVMIDPFKNFVSSEAANNMAVATSSSRPNSFIGCLFKKSFIAFCGSGEPFIRFSRDGVCVVPGHYIY
jgi:hypothetical protein